MSRNELDLEHSHQFNNLSVTISGHKLQNMWKKSNVYIFPHCKKVQVGKDQEKAQSEKDSHSKNRGGKKPNLQSGTYVRIP